MKEKAVSQYEGGKFLAQYRSASVAALITGVDNSHLYKVATGVRAKTGGYSFKYIKSFGISSNTRVVLRDATNTILAIFRDRTTASRYLGIPVKDLVTAELNREWLALRGYGTRVTVGN